MQTPDLIKLAPTLSVEERYKLIVPDFQRVMAGEKELLSESEQNAITFFEKKEDWQVYVHKICLLQWANILWQRDIETEKLRALACSLMLSHALEKLLIDGDDKSISKEKRDGQFEQVKQCVARFEKQSVEFYAYPLAIKKIEQELYSMPIFDEKRGKRIASYYEAVDDMIEHHNESVRIFCGNPIIKKTIKPVVQDMGKYIVKKQIPDSALVDIICEEIRHIADGETRRMS
jgi:hypothetical protein